jgi:hypothetical protein
MMRSWQCVFIVLSMWLSSVATAAPTQKITDLATFLTTTLEGKKFKSESHGLLPSGVRYDFYRTISYNAIRVGDTLSYHLNWSIKQDNFDPLPDGTFAPTPVNKDRFGFSRCEFTEMKSTKELQGSCTVLANSLGYSFSVDRVVATFADDRLTLKAETPGYADLFASGDTYVPGRSSSVTEIYKDEQGRTVSRDVLKLWNVDPQTLEPVGDVTTYPEQVIIGE